MKIEKAVRQAIPCVCCLYGKSGSGKTYSALKLATGLANGGKICVIDTENGRSSHYADTFNFDVLKLSPPFNSLRYLEAFNLIENEGYSVLIIDSISHEWDGIGGCCERAEEGKTSTGKTLTGLNKWSKVKPEHRKLIQCLLQSKMHLIFCARAKDLLEQEGVGSTATITNKGLIPIQEKNFYFEMLITFSMQDNGKATLKKCPGDLRHSLEIPENSLITEEHGKIIFNWINKATPKDFRITELYNAGLEYAENGNLTGLREWYRGLSQKDKAIVMENQIDVELKKIANIVINDNDLPNVVDSVNKADTNSLADVKESPKIINNIV